MKKTDVAIVGGGLTGVAAAYIAARCGFNVVHFAPKMPTDLRTSALMRPSTDFLEQAELLMEPSDIGVPLTKIRIIDATQRLLRSPETLFDSAEAGWNSFGWNLPNAALLSQIEERATEFPNLTTIQQSVVGLLSHHDTYELTAEDGTVVSTNLVIGADGRNSPTRTFAQIPTRNHKFQQMALVCDVELTKPLDGTSVEFHYENGPFTLVPAGGTKANLVWIDQQATLEKALKLDAKEFSALLGKKSHHLFGKIASTTKAVTFPLSTLSVSTAAKDGILLVGEAAHAFPPIGAQGLNLGLRDVADLATALQSQSERGTNWSRNVSKAYAELRSSDLQRTSTVVDALFRSLLSDFLPTQSVRATGLWSLKLLPGLRKSAFKIGMGR